MNKPYCATCGRPLAEDAQDSASCSECSSRFVRRTDIRLVVTLVLGLGLLVYLALR
jgi:DNA-directed RNA polymerase subunit RPC12/RpoP